MISSERLARAAEEELGLVRIAIEELRRETIETLSAPDANPDTALKAFADLQALARVERKLLNHKHTHTLNTSQS